ncbi:MAG: hypothetical protein RLP44_32670 [Aggregatilineales bacterium]
MHPYIVNAMNEDHLREMHERYQKDELVKIALASRNTRKSPIARAITMLIVLFGVGAV